MHIHLSSNGGIIIQFESHSTTSFLHMAHGLCEECECHCVFECIHPELCFISLWNTPPSCLSFSHKCTHLSSNGGVIIQCEIWWTHSFLHKAHGLCEECHCVIECIHPELCFISLWNTPPSCLSFSDHSSTLWWFVYFEKTSATRNPVRTI